MSTAFIKNAIRDVVPTLEEPYPEELIEYANSLYALSKIRQALNPKYEVARYHLCCYLTVEKLCGRLNLPDPVDDKIPIPNRKVRSAIVDFKRGLTVNSATPPQTPRKRRRRRAEHQLLTPPSTGKRNHTRETFKYTNPYLTPSKTPSSKTPIIDIDSPKYMGSGKSMRERLRAAASESDEPPRKKRTYTKSPHKAHSKSKLQISTAMLVSFCNRFYIPESTTRNILNTFQIYHARIKQPWGLLCGLVAISYSDLNHDLMNSRIGFKSKLYEQLQILQTGGLSMDDIVMWVRIVENLCSEEPWLKHLKKLTEEAEGKRKVLGIPSLTSFLDSSVCYHSVESASNYKSWVGGL